MKITATMEKYRENVDSVGPSKRRHTTAAVDFFQERSNSPNQTPYSEIKLERLLERRK